MNGGGPSHLNKSAVKQCGECTQINVKEYMIRNINEIEKNRAGIARFF